MAPELTRLGQTLLLVQRIYWILAQDDNTCSQHIIQFLDNLEAPGCLEPKSCLEWIRQYGNDDGVLYFLDDDNTVNIKVFDEMRYTRKVSMWPVGLVGGYPFSTPVLDQENATMPYNAGYEEDGFLKSLNISLADIEAKADSCTTILVWHTKTMKQQVLTLNVTSEHTEDNLVMLASKVQSGAII